jgi:hypothetical protein
LRSQTTSHPDNLAPLLSALDKLAIAASISCCNLDDIDQLLVTAVDSCCIAAVDYSPITAIVNHSNLITAIVVKEALNTRIAVIVKLSSSPL